nr:unnamed protein product [Spirometra erinaceieuropaei]
MVCIQSRPPRLPSSSSYCSSSNNTNKHTHARLHRTTSKARRLTVFRDVFVLYRPRYIMLINIHIRTIPTPLPSCYCSLRSIHEESCLCWWLCDARDHSSRPLFRTRSVMAVPDYSKPTQKPRSLDYPQMTKRCRGRREGMPQN